MSDEAPGPKMVLTFDMHHHRNEYLMAMDGPNFWSALWEVDQFCRGVIKHDDGSINKEGLQALETVRELIREHCDIHQVS